MRLFIAITFDEALKDCLCQVMERLRLQTVKGSFTLRENLHLTMNFIGETERVKPVQQAMEQAVRKAGAQSFLLNIRGFGRFKRREGDICWIGVEQVAGLLNLQRELQSRLETAGFILEDRNYKPHLTLARRAVFDGEFDEKAFGMLIPPMKLQVQKVSLMNSERIGGKLVYTELYHVKLPLAF